MKALISRDPGPATSLAIEDMPAPQPRAGEVLIRTLAVGLNFPDSLIIEDKYQIKPARPFAPGSELCGEIIGLGAGVDGFAVGDRVVGVPLHGTLAEVVCVPAHMVAKAPAALSDTQASILPMVYGTAWHALAERGGLRAGERVLVLGAGGGIGLAACGIAAALGAKVTAAASSEAKLALARRHGAQSGLVYPLGMEPSDQKTFAGDLKAASEGQGFDIIIDPVGGAYAEPSLRSIAWGGRYMVVGFTAGIPKFPGNLPLLKGCDIRGVFWGQAIERDKTLFAAQIAALAELIATDNLMPEVAQTYPFAKAATAIAALSDRAVAGKLAVTVAT